MRRALSVLILVPILSGCLVSREISHLRRDAERALGTPLEREFVITLGPRTFRAVGWVARRVPDPWLQMAGDMAGEIDWVKVGVFRAEERPDSVRLGPSTMPRLASSGWDVLARTRSGDAATWIMTRERHGSVRDLLVLAFDGSELVVVRFEGWLDALVERALADRGFLEEMTGESLRIPG